MVPITRPAHASEDVHLVAFALERRRKFSNVDSHAAKGNSDRGIQDYDQAIRLKPYFANAYYNRGNAYALLKDYSRAIQDYNEAIRLNPDFAEAYYLRGVTYGNLGQPPRAIQTEENENALAIVESVMARGDANLSGVIDISDLGILAGHYGDTNATWLTGDFNFDGKSDLGKKMDKGSYILRLETTDLDTKTRSHSSRMVVIK